MGSKVLVLLGLSIAFTLLISSEVAARDLAETTRKTTDAAVGYGEVSGPQTRRPYNGRGPYYGGGGGSGGGGPYNRGGGRGRGCYYSCYGRCCSAAEAKALQAITTNQVKPHN
ncbi:hypothetical protein ACET3Z_017453 [Daucus carota]|nr:PREDICTED: glycine-rich protein DC7.1-like [Daucus carota subsp. sativus]